MSDDGDDEGDDDDGDDDDEAEMIFVDSSTSSASVRKFPLVKLFDISLSFFWKCRI